MVSTTDQSNVIKLEFVLEEVLSVCGSDADQAVGDCVGVLCVFVFSIPHAQKEKISIPASAIVSIFFIAVTSKIKSVCNTKSHTPKNA